jgi:acid-sensing ion channel, other
MMNSMQNPKAYSHMQSIYDETRNVILFTKFPFKKNLGIKYLTDKQRHWTEKLFWAIALTLSIAACSYLIYDSLRRCFLSPLLLSFSPKFLNIWEIPFAAITICPIGSVNPLNENYNLSIQSRVRPLKNFSGMTEQRITNLKFRNDLTPSSELFTEIVTQEGFCWTFNMLNFADLFREDV